MNEDKSDKISIFPSGLSAVVQKTVIRGEFPALVVVHDDEDDWLVGDGVNDPNEDDACGLYHMDHVVALDETIQEAAGLGVGFAAARDSAGDPWVVSKWEYSD
jgi:hypothetical protein